VNDETKERGGDQTKGIENSRTHTIGVSDGFCVLFGSGLCWLNSFVSALILWSFIRFVFLLFEVILFTRVW